MRPPYKGSWPGPDASASLQVSLSSSTVFHYCPIINVVLLLSGHGSPLPSGQWFWRVKGLTVASDIIFDICICVVNCDEWKGESGGSEGVVVTPHECSCSACAWYASPWIPGYPFACSALASSNNTSVLIQSLVCKPLCGSIFRCYSSPLPPPLAQYKVQCPVRYNVLIMIVTLIAMLTHCDNKPPTVTFNIIWQSLWPSYDIQPHRLWLKTSWRC